MDISKPPIITAIAGTTLIIAASYMLYLFKNVFYGTLKQTHITQSLKDLGFKEFCVLGPIAFVIIWLGVFPNTLLKPMQVSVQQLVGTTYTLAQEQTTKEHIAKVNNSLVIERAMLNNTIMDNLGELPPPTPQRESMDSNTESQSIDNQSNSTNKEE